MPFVIDRPELPKTVAGRLEFVAWLLDPTHPETGERMAPLITPQQAKEMLEMCDG